MIELDENNILMEDYIKAVLLKSSEGYIEILFSDRTSKQVAKIILGSDFLDILDDIFIRVNGMYINPNLVKGFKNLRDGRVKVYFPDATSLTLYLDDDDFESLKVFFTDDEEE